MSPKINPKDSVDHLAPSTIPGYVDAYIAVKLESVPNKTQVARLVKRDFKLPHTVEVIRRRVRTIAAKNKITLKRKPIRRLFFDIETSPAVFWAWRPGQQYLRPENLLQDAKIICICWKWQFEDKVHHLTWDRSRKEDTMLKAFVKVLDAADEVVAHNGDKFDLRWLRARCAKHRLLMFPRYRTLDTLKKARTFFNFPSNKLDYIGQYLGVGRKVKHRGSELWTDVAFKNDRNALREMVKYCKGDIVLLEDVFLALAPYVDHNTNFAVLRGGNKWECPECCSAETRLDHTETTPMGYIKRFMKCDSCKKSYPVSNKTYLRMLRDAAVPEK